MSSGLYAPLPVYLTIIAIIFYRNSFYWIRHWTNLNSSAYLLSELPSTFDTEILSPPYIQMLLDNVSMRSSVFLSSTEEKGGGDQLTDDAKATEQAPEPTPEEPQEQPEPPPEEPPKSRIPTYDEFARFKDSSRPPDSHYPPGPVRGCSGNSKLSCFLIVWSLFLVFVV